MDSTDLIALTHVCTQGMEKTVRWNVIVPNHYAVILTDALHQMKVHMHFIMIMCMNQAELAIIENAMSLIDKFDGVFFIRKLINGGHKS